MKTLLMVLLALASIVLIASVLLQSGNSAGLSGSIAGGAEQLFAATRGTPPVGQIRPLPTARRRYGPREKGWGFFQYTP